MKFKVAKVGYEYVVSEKTATVTREDGAWAKVHDDENDISDWETVLIEMVADDSIRFIEVEQSAD